MSTFVQAKGQGGTPGATTWTLSLTGVGAGNDLRMLILTASTSITVVSVKDGAGNSATLVDSLNANSTINQSAILPNAVGGNMTLTVTFSASNSNFARWAVEEWSGDATSPLDGHAMGATADGTANTVLTSGNLTPGTSGDDIWCIIQQAQGHAPSVGTNVAWVLVSSNIGSQAFWTEHFSQATAATIAGQWLSAASSFNNLIAAMGFKQSGGGGGPVYIPIPIRTKLLYRPVYRRIY